MHQIFIANDIYDDLMYYNIVTFNVNSRYSFRFAKTCHSLCLIGNKRTSFKKKNCTRNKRSQKKAIIIKKDTLMVFVVNIM